MSARHCREIGKMGAEHEQSDSDREFTGATE